VSDRYKILGTYWHTPTFEGLDPVESMLIGGSPPSVCVVAIQSGPEGKHWKAYLAIVNSKLPVKVSEQNTAACGCKVEKRIACAYFPDLNPEGWRE
jgi:hypothetical protein